MLIPKKESKLTLSSNSNIFRCLQQHFDSSITAKDSQNPSWLWEQQPAFVDARFTPGPLKAASLIVGWQEAAGLEQGEIKRKGHNLLHFYYLFYNILKCSNLI